MAYDSRTTAVERAIFISYRREDSIAHAGRLADRLSAHFGKNRVFIDVDAIPPGDDFVDVLTEKVAACDTLIAVIGRHWLDAADENGKRRLDNPEDFVLLEIRAALERKVRVIPALVGGAEMPRSLDLPESIRGLARRHAISISDTTFHMSVSKLIETLALAPDSPAARASVRSPIGAPDSPPAVVSEPPSTVVPEPVVAVVAESALSVKRVLSPRTFATGADDDRDDGVIHGHDSPRPFFAVVGSLAAVLGFTALLYYLFFTPGRSDGVDGQAQLALDQPPAVATPPETPPQTIRLSEPSRATAPAPQAAPPESPPATSATNSERQPSVRPQNRLTRALVPTPDATSSAPAAVRVGGDVKVPRKVKDATPTYPPLAKAARVQGVVIIEATIGPGGTVQEARVVRSIPLLDSAALDAVRQWEFTPTLVNGVAVPVILTTTVAFILQDSDSGSTKPPN